MPDDSRESLRALPAAIRGRSGRLDPALALTVAVLFAAVAAHSFRLVSFLHAKDAVLAYGGAVLALPAFARGSDLRPGFRAFLPLWLGLGLCAALGLAQAAAPHRVIEDSIRYASWLLLAGAACARLKDGSARRALARAIAGLAMLTAASALLQVSGLVPAWLPAVHGYDQPAYGLFGNQGLTGGFEAMGIPLALVFVRRRAALALALGLLVPAVVVSETRSAWLAAALGAAAALAIRRCGNRERAAWALFIALWAVASGLAYGPRIADRIAETLDGSSEGVAARWWFWDGTLRMIAEHPVMGVGLGNYSAHSPRFLGEALRAPGGDAYGANERLTEHAHSEPLHLLAETGLVGAAFFAWMLVRLLRRPDPAWPALLTAGVFGLFYFPFQSGPHAAAVLVLAGGAVCRGAANAQGSTGGRSVAWCAAGAALALALAHTGTVLIPSARLCAAEDLHLAGGDPRAAYARATAYPWPAPEAHETYAMYLLEQGEAEAAAAELEAARPAIDSGRLHFLRAQAALARGDRGAAAAALADCLERWPRVEAVREWMAAAGFHGVSGAGPQAPPARRAPGGGAN